MNNKLIVSLVAVALILGGYGAFRGSPEKVVEKYITEKQLGALTGPDIASLYLKWGNFETQRAGSDFNTGTSTLCAIEKPTATSTLKSFSGLPTTSTSTSVLLVLQESASPSAPVRTAATTTNIYITSHILAANSLDAFATSSVLNSSTINTVVNKELSPGGYLLFWAKEGGAGSIPTTLGSGSNVFASGICKAEFDVVGR